MIQEIAPHRYDNAYRPSPPQPDSYILYYEDHRALVLREESGIDFPRLSDLSPDNPGISDDCTYLFSVDGRGFYLAEHVTVPTLSRFTMEHTEIFRTARPGYLAFAGITGFQLFLWYRDHHFCGRCGQVLVKDQKERMLYCETCHTMEYPRLSPAVIIGLTDGNRLLLSKYAGRTYKKYALLAGFVEIGETVEDTVRREVMEEVGLRVKNIRYYGSQPWSFTGTVLMGYFCDLDGSDEILLDREELAMAEWFEREDLPDDDTHISLTWDMITQFKEGNI